MGVEKSSPDGGLSLEAEAVRRALADRDFPCPACGYNLRGAAGVACPECGAAIRIGQAISPRLPDDAFAIGLAGLAVFLLVGALLLALHIPELGAPSVVTGGLGAVLWVRHHRWVRSRPAGGRLLLALLCWSWPLALLAFGSLLEAAGELTGWN